MRTLPLIFGAALLCAACPAIAQSQWQSQGSQSSGSNWSGAPQNGSHWSHHGDHHGSSPFDHFAGDSRSNANTAVVMETYGGEWARYNNRGWDPDSFNDWWHDRPDRAYPRWVQHNQNCTPDRMWWSGSGWHC